jgi:hypothetical protein
MPNPYYKTSHWRRLRALRLALDKHACVGGKMGQLGVSKCERSWNGDSIRNSADTLKIRE